MAAELSAYVDWASGFAPGQWAGAICLGLVPDRPNRLSECAGDGNSGGFAATSLPGSVFWGCGGPAEPQDGDDRLGFASCFDHTSADGVLYAGQHPGVAYLLSHVLALAFWHVSNASHERFHHVDGSA